MAVINSFKCVAIIHCGQYKFLMSTEILDAYQTLKNSASEDAFRKFLLIIKANEEQVRPNLPDRCVILAPV